MQTRALVGVDVGYTNPQVPGQAIMSQLQYENNTTVGASTLTVSSLLRGIINRSGAVGAYIDTLPTVNQLLTACPQLSVGDSFTFVIRNTVAQILTLAVGTGWTLGSNTAIAASLVREYLVTITGAGATSTFSATTTSGNKTLSNVSAAAIALLQPGMLLTGTGIAASTKIVAVNASTGVVTTDTNSTATGNNVAITADPTATIEGVRSSTL